MPKMPQAPTKLTSTLTGHESADPGPTRKPTLVSGKAVTKLTITPDTRDKSIPPRRFQEEQNIGPVTVPVGCYAMVGAKHRTVMSINFQTVEAESFIQVPVPFDPQRCPDPNKDPNVQAAADACWSFVSEQLAFRTEWCSSIMATLQEERRKGEAKR